MEYGIDDKYMKELREILASIPEIEEAVLYGSRARGDYKRGSDIDLSLKGEKFGAGAVGAPPRQALSLPVALFR